MDTTDTRRVGKKAQRQAEEAARRRAREQAEQRKRMAVIGGGVLAAAVVIALIVVLAIRPATTTAGELGQSMPDQGRTHVNPGEPHPAYNTTPPTSGWHYPNWAPWGMHPEPIPNELQLHDLEHGGVLIQYNCASEQPNGPLEEQDCRQLVDSVTGIVRRYPSKVIGAPYPEMEHRIAVTAWGRIMTLDSVDEARIRKFVDQYRNQGPERVPD